MTRTVPIYLTSTDIGHLIDKAKVRVVLALPSLPEGLAPSLIEAARRLPGRVLVILDSDERVYRLGYGSFKDVEEVFGALPLLRRSGLRLGCGLIDEVGFFLTLPPNLVEAPPEMDIKPVNASLVEPQLAMSYLRGIANCPELGEVLQPHPDFPPSASEDPVERAKENARAEEERPLAEPFIEEEVEVTKKNLEIAPPLNFQVHQQSMVYSALLLYVEVEMTGCNLANRELSVSQILLPLLGEKSNQVARHTFPLRPDLHSDGLEDIRRRKQHLITRLARNLGKPYGTVVLRKDESRFWREVDSIRAEIQTKHPIAIAAFKKGLGDQLEAIAEVCFQQCKATMNEQSIIKALCPGTRDRMAYDDWKEWANSSPSSLEVDQALHRRISDGLESNLEKMLGEITMPRLDVMVREFTFQQMNEDEFTICLLDAFKDEPELAPYLESQAVIGRPTP